jgi:hypothetical protein
MLPSCPELNEESTPLKEPIGVLFADTITVFFIMSFMK